MAPILFLFRKTIKNWFVEAVKHPGKLILYIVIILMVGIGVLGNVSSGEALDDASIQLDPSILHGIYFIILFFVGILILGTSLKSGTTLFTMSEVNLLFVSPVSSKLILAAGLIKQMGTLVLLFVIFLLYSGMIHSLFVITPLNTIVIIGGVIIFALCCQIIAMAVYSFINSNVRRIRAAKCVLYICVLAVISVIGVQIILNGFNLNSLYSALKSPLAEAVPIFGWMKGLIFSITDGNILKAIIYGILMLLSTGCAIGYFIFCQPDYYEDVLQNTESTYEMRQALKSGKMVDRRDFSNSRKISLRGMGIGGGHGASVFFFKHMREIKRRSRLMFFNMFSFILLALFIFMAVFMSNIDDSDPMPSQAILMSLLAMGVYMQMFFSAAGEWGRELLKPYIYLVPDSAFKKLFFASLTSIVKPFFDGILCYTAVGLYLKSNPLDIIMCILVYSSLGAVYSGANILTERILSGLNIQSIAMLLYILTSFLILLPGIIIAIILGVFLESFLIGLIPMLIWNIAASIILYAISKNTIHNMETNL